MWPQYRVLVVSFLRIAWRGPAGAGGGKRQIGALAHGFRGYLIIAAILLVFALITPGERMAGFFVQSMSFMMIALAFLSIYGDLVFDARDVPILFWRPLDSRAYLAARFTAIVVYFAAVTTVMNLPAALALGLRFGPVWYALAHMVGAYAGALAALCIGLLLLFSMLRFVGRERVRDTVAWVQIAATFLFFGANQLVVRAGVSQDTPASLFTGKSAFFLPMSWAQAIADVIALRPLPGQREVALFGIAVPLGVTTLLVLLFGRTYAEILRALGEGEAKREAPVSKGILQPWLERFASDDPIARAGFLLAWATIRRARDYKVRAIPQFGLPVVFCVMAFVGNMPPAAAIVPAMLAFASCNGLVFLLGSEHAEAAWVWGLAANATPRSAQRGAALAVLGALAVPVVIVVGAGAVFFWGPLHGLGFVFFSLALAVACLRWMLGTMTELPCTLTLEKARKETAGFGNFAMFMLAAFLAGLDTALVALVGPWITPVLAAPILYWGWRGLARRRYAYGVRRADAADGPSGRC